MPISTNGASLIGAVMYQLLAITDQYRNFPIPVAEFYACNHYQAFDICQTIMFGDSDRNWFGDSKMMVELNERANIHHMRLDMITDSEVGDDEDRYESTDVAQWNNIGHNHLSELVYLDAPDRFEYKIILTAPHVLTVYVERNFIPLVQSILKHYFDTLTIEHFPYFTIGSMEQLRIVLPGGVKHPDIVREALATYLDRRY